MPSLGKPWSIAVLCSTNKKHGSLLKYGSPRQDTGSGTSRPEPNLRSRKTWSYQGSTQGPAPTVDTRHDKRTWFYATDVISVSTRNAPWKKEERITTGVHSSAPPVKDKLFVKAFGISWKTGHCMLTSGPAPSHKMRKNGIGF